MLDLNCYTSVAHRQKSQRRRRRTTGAELYSITLQKFTFKLIGLWAGFTTFLLKSMSYICKLSVTWTKWRPVQKLPHLIQPCGIFCTNGTESIPAGSFVRFYPQSVAEINHYLVLSEDRIRQCVTSSGSRHKDTDQCL